MTGVYQKIPQGLASSDAYAGGPAKTKQSPAPKQDARPSGPPKLSKRQWVPVFNAGATAADTVAFLGWAPLNGTAGVAAEVTTFKPDYPASAFATTGVPAGINAALEPIGLLDTMNTAAGTVNAVLTLKQTSDTYKKAKKGRWNDHLGEFAYINASAAKREAEGNAKRTVPGFLRDVLGGLAGAASRMKTLIGGDPLFGVNAGNAPDYAFGGVSFGTYLVAGFAQSDKVDNAAGRVYGVNDAARNAINGRNNAARTAVDKRRNAARNEVDEQNTAALRHNEHARQLDAMFERREISGNVYSIVRARPEGHIDTFVGNWEKLDAQGKARLNKLMHFSAAYNGKRVFDMSRTTNLNTPAVRRAAREAVLDVFVSANLQSEAPSGADDELHDRVAKLLDDARTARKEALGAKVAPNIEAVQKELEDAGIKLEPNVVRAIARSGCSKQFVKEYLRLGEEDERNNTNHQAELQKILHFVSWRFWRRDATLPTTKYQRADIRLALVKRFAAGMPLKELKTLKVRYNQKVVPLRTAHTHTGPAVDNVMIEHILAAQDTKLDALKEEKRDAKVKIIYGLANGAAAVAESAVNPAAASGVSATRAILSAPYLLYAARRGLSNLINQRNATPVTAGLREDALLKLLPATEAAIEHYSTTEPGFIHGLKDHVYFLNKEFGLTAKEIKGLEELEKKGKHSAVRAFLIRRKPEANVLIALRRIVEENVDTPREIEAEYAEAKAAALEAAIRPARRIEQLERARIVQESPGLLDPALDKKVKQATAERCRQLAQDNPILATRLFVEELLSTDPEVAARARGMLREFRFNEHEIWQLTQLGRDAEQGGMGERKKVADALQNHLLGEGLRRRFSTRKLKKGRRDAIKILRDMRTLPGEPPLLSAKPGDNDEPLSWRYDLESVGINTVDNAGAPGLDSMLHALQQHFAGNTNYSSNPIRRRAMRQRLVRARQRVLAEVPRQVAAPTAAAARNVRGNIDNGVMEYINYIVEIAAQEFGKPGARVMVVETGEGGKWKYAGGAPEKDTEPAAVVCFDSQTNRTFALDAVYPENWKRLQQSNDANERRHRAGHSKGNRT